MHRVLLVAEGTLDHPLRNIASIFTGMTITLACGFIVVRSDMPLPLMILTFAVLLVGVAWLKARFSGQRQFRLEKRRDDEALRITGRFEEGHVGSSQPRDLVAAELADDGLYFTTTHDQGTERFRLGPPAFAPESLELLHRAVHDLQTLSLTEIHSRYSRGSGAIRFYDAKKLVLLRFNEKPGYMTVLWLAAGFTVLFWLVAGRLLLP